MHQNNNTPRIISVNDIFKKLEDAGMPSGLPSAILSRIQDETVKRARMRFFAMSLVSVAALISIVPAYRYASGEMANSGFSDYFAVFFSSPATLAHWREFGSSLLETLPIAGFAVLMTAVFALLGSFRIAAKNIPNLKLA